MIEWMHPGQTVNQKYYIEVLMKLKERVRKKRPDLWKNNAPAHNAFSVKQFLADKRILILEQLPHLPDLAFCEFYLFPKLKITLKRTRFQTIEEVKTKAAAQLQGLTSDDLQHCFEQWKTRMQRCVDRGGEYIEGDHS